MSAVAAVLLLAACSGSARTVTLVSYNVENLFDAEVDGGEYREFTRAGGWSEALYTAKLRAIGRALAAAERGGADLVALQEVEHYGAARRLLELELDGLGYRHVAWLPDPHNANGPVVLSKLPVRRVGALWADSGPVAAAEVGLEGGLARPLRPILEVEVALGSEADAPSLFLFNNHWKSKSGGAAETEVYRRRAAALLAARIEEISAADPAAEIVVVGDLNESIDEYERQGRRYATALMPANDVDAGGGLRVTGSVPPGRAPLQLFSPWLAHDAGEAPPGSYRYRDTWETIDHVLLGPGLFDDAGLSYAGGTGFAVIYDGLLDAGGAPLAFYRGPPPGGYSDHLPLRLELTLHPPPIDGCAEAHTPSPFAPGKGSNRAATGLRVPCPRRRQSDFPRPPSAAVRAGEPFQRHGEVAQPVAGGGVTAPELQKLTLHARIAVKQRRDLVAGELQGVGQLQGGVGQAHTAQRVADGVQVEVQAGRPDRNHAALQGRAQEIVLRTREAAQVERIGGHVQQGEVVGAGVRQHVLVAYCGHVAVDGARGGLAQRLVGGRFLHRLERELGVDRHLALAELDHGIDPHAARQGNLGGEAGTRQPGGQQLLQQAFAVSAALPRYGECLLEAHQPPRQLVELLHAPAHCTPAGTAGAHRRHHDQRYQDTAQSGGAGYQFQAQHGLAPIVGALMERVNTET